MIIAIAGVLQRIAKRLELVQRAAEARAAERRAQNEIRRGTRDIDRACSHIQRCTRAFVFSNRQRNMNEERLKRHKKRMARRESIARAADYTGYAEFTE